MRDVKGNKNNPIPESGITTPCITNLLCTGLLVIAGCIVYSNTFHNPFVFDDINFITQNNPHLHLTELSWESLKEGVANAQPAYRILPKASFALNYYFGGESPTGFHLINLIIHLLTGILLFLFVQYTLRLPAARIERAVDVRRHPQTLTFISFLAALVWIAHPMNTNAVTYMCQRMTSMTAMFYMLSMLAYARSRIAWRSDAKKSSCAYFLICLSAGACAVASKENAVMLPVFILVYEWFFFQDLKDIRAYRMLPWLLMGLTAFVAIAVIYLGENPFQHILATYTERNFTMPQRVMTEFRVVAYYLSLLIFPHPSRLLLDHDYPLSYSLINPHSTLICMALIISSLAAGVYLAKKNRLISFCILWCLGNLAVESSIVGIEIIFEHRMYLPSMMICLMAVLLVFRKTKSLWPAAGLMAALAVMLSVWTYQRNIIWQSDVSFWKDCAIKSPEKARPYQNLAFSYQIQRNFKEAIVNYRKSIRIKPHAVAYFNLGLALNVEKSYLDAVNAFIEALKMGYNTPGVQSNLAQALARIGEFDDAVKHFNIALKMSPSDAATRHNLQELQNFLSSCNDPITCVKTLMTQEPENAALYYKWGALNEKQGNLEEAKAAYETALAKLGDFDQRLKLLTLNRLGMIYMDHSDTGRALDLFTAGIRVAPEQPHFYYQIATLYAGLDDSQKAIQWLDEAVKRGFADWAQIQNDKRWDTMRNTPYYQQLKNRF